MDICLVFSVFTPGPTSLLVPNRNFVFFLIVFLFLHNLLSLHYIIYRIRWEGVMNVECIRNWKEVLWPTSRFCSGICSERLKKTTQTCHNSQ
jgi:hypothetical protein